MESKDLTIKEIIVDKAIQMLKAEGLKFSVDELTSDLKISKKTLYKHFATKEELATVIYAKLFKDLHFNADRLITSTSHMQSQLVEMLKLIETALIFNDEGIFNRYALNDIIKKFAIENLETLWQKAEVLFKLLGHDKLICNKCFKDVTFAALKALTRKNLEVSDFLSLLIEV